MKLVSHQKQNLTVSPFFSFAFLQKAMPVEVFCNSQRLPIDACRPVARVRAAGCVILLDPYATLLSMHCCLFPFSRLGSSPKVRNFPKATWLIENKTFTMTPQLARPELSFPCFSPFLLAWRLPPSLTSISMTPGKGALHVRCHLPEVLSPFLLSLPPHIHLLTPCTFRSQFNIITTLRDTLSGPQTTSVSCQLQRCNYP